MNNESKKFSQKKKNSVKASSRKLTSAKKAFFLLLAIFAVGNLLYFKVGAAGTITGTVFEDFNGNGNFDTSGGTTIAPTAIDVGVAGITVTAYDSSGAQQGTATTIADGSYSLGATGTGPYRIEFTNIPAGFQPSARSTDSVSGGATTNSGSTVQFVADGNTTNVNLAINRPEEYCQNNPNLVTCRFNSGAQNGTYAANPVVQEFPYSAGAIYTDTTLANYLNPTTHQITVPASSVGSVYGLAYSRSTRRIFTSAFYKRFVGFGSGADTTYGTADDPGAIYVINPANNTVVNRFTVPGATTNSHENPTTTVSDSTNASANGVGKTSLGGMALSDDESRLFVMNLENKSLYALDPTTGASLGNQAVPTPATCPTATDVRPFAVEFFRGTVYVGMVCSAESSANAANLRAYVYQVDPTTLAFGANPYVVSLNYNRGGNEPGNNPAEWRPWTSVIPSAFVFPQPMLASISFDNGNLLLGFRDRAGDQGTDALNRPAGEVLRVCGTLTSFPNNLTLEANGRCAGAGTAPQNTGQGPGALPGTDAGSGEYFFNDDFSNAPNSNNYHDEVLYGATIRLPGYGQTVSTSFDPNPRTSLDVAFTGGARWLNNANGASTKAYILYQGDGNVNTGGEFGKSNGLGDIIALCDSAPIEIGNRVWNDTNGNGVQDPGEAGIAGVTVELYNGATPVTYVRYRDRFDAIAYNGTNGSVDWSGFPWTEVSDDNSATGGDVQVIATTSASLVNLVRIGGTLTGLDNNGISRPISLTGSSSATLTFNYFRAAQGLIVQYSSDNGANYNNLQTYAVASDTVLQSGSLSLPVNATNIRFLNSTTGTTNYVYLDNVQITTNATATTDANGEYYFSSISGTSTSGAATSGNAIFDADIQPNTAYQLRFSGAPISALTVTAPNATAQLGNDDSNDSDVIRSGGLNVINFTTGAAGSNDHTQDAGFAAPVSIGSTVFNDANNDGLLNNGETGISGVLVQLLYDSNNDGVIDGAELTRLVEINTDASGNYFFNGLTPGLYQVRIPTPPATATLSSAPAVTDTADNQQDNDDNGTQATAGGETLSPLIRLMPGLEPVDGAGANNETGTGSTLDNTSTDANGDMTVDFGFVAPATLGNRVWIDTNRNGIQDVSETAGLDGVTVTLYDTANNVVGTRTTAGGGLYSFTNLFPGTYYVIFTRPNGYGFSPQDAAGSTEANDSDANILTGRTANVTLVAGQNNPDVDAGVFLSVAVGNRVWNDINNNGIFDSATETGISGLTVNLYLDSNDNGVADGGIIRTTTTDANGLYQFSGLAPDTYIVGVVTPANYVSSSVKGGDPDNNIDNDNNGVVVAVNPVNAVETRSNPVTLSLGAEPTGETPTDPTTPDNSSNYTVDFGFTRSYSIGNRVWFDTNNDGQINAGEVGINGVSVSIFASSDTTFANPLQTTTTAAETNGNGYYRFDNLTPGSYVVRINPSNFATNGILIGYQNTAGNNGANLDSTAVAGQNGEDGINPTGAANSVLTNGIVSNVKTIAANSTSEPQNESDVQTSGQGTADNQANMTIDFGFYRMSLSGTVWSDNGNGNAALRNNGILNAGEPGIGNVPVRLYFGTTTTEVPVGPDGILGTLDDAAGGVGTDASGNYNFQGLPPGDYRVVVNLPNGGTSSSPASADPNGNLDNDDNGFLNTNEGFPGRIISGVINLSPANEVSLSNATGETFNPTVDFGFVFAGPTLVQLDKFDAYTDGGSVELKWSTGNETGNLGFNVYREVDGKRELLNAAPIAGNALRSSVQLQASGSDYSWTDKNFVSNAVYYLEDLDIDGSATLHGAATPEFRQTLGNQPNAKMFSDLTTVESSATREIFADQTLGTSSNIKTLATAAQQQAQIAARGGAKIIVNHDSWYRVSVQQLQAAGFDTNSDSRLWQLFADGVEVPVKMNGDSIEFYGHGLDTQLTDKQAYYLINNRKAGLRINTVEGGGVEGSADAQSFPITVERKDRTIYFSGLVNGEENENWFGAVVSGSRDTAQNLNAVNVDRSGRARLSVKLQGIVENNHYVKVRFNDLDLGIVEFNGYENKQFEFYIPASSVLEGANTVYLRSNGAGSDISVVDSIRLGYQHGYTASGNRLRFRVPANQTVRVNGFTEEKISVYELRNGAAVQQVVGVSENAADEFGFSLSAANADREMIAVVNSSVEQATVETNAPSALSNSNNKADFVIITASELGESADRLAAMREAQGLKTKVVMVDDVFDEFSFGRRDPQAVKQFLKTAATKWQTKPQYALLFGDASYDSRNNLGLPQTRDLVPTKMIDTANMETSSDAWLADFDDDGAEDIALGRLPVGNASEAAAAIEKLARFDNQKERQKKTDVLIADTGFAGYSADLQLLLPADVASFRIDRGETTDAETHQNIIAHLNDSPLLVTYTGHGSESVWATGGVFNSNDIAALNNSELSFYLLMNCLNGYIQKPLGDSLGETLFRSENSAVAVWTSSGVTSPDSQAAISRAFTNLVFNGRAGSSMRVGDVVRASKQATTDTDVRRTWQLVGDPTVIVK